MEKSSERWTVLPFSLGCTSRSSVAVGNEIHPDSSTKTSKGTQVKHKGSSSTIVKKSHYTFGFSLPRPNISRRIRILVRSIMSVSQIFVYKDEEEAEMEIGFPTDVKHLTHIGWDGSTTVMNNPVKGWESLAPPGKISLPSISLKQFELAMSAQANGKEAPQLLVNSSQSKPVS